MAEGSEAERWSRCVCVCVYYCGENDRNGKLNNKRMNKKQFTKEGCPVGEADDDQETSRLYDRRKS